MITLPDGEIRARVLKAEGQAVELGVYLEGAWRRIRARALAQPPKGAWIRGRLQVHEDGETIIFKLTAEESRPGDQPQPPAGGLDLEA